MQVLHYFMKAYRGSFLAGAGVSARAGRPLICTVEMFPVSTPTSIFADIAGSVRRNSQALKRSG